MSNSSRSSELRVLNQKYDLGRLFEKLGPCRDQADDFSHAVSKLKGKYITEHGGGWQRQMILARGDVQQGRDVKISGC